MNLITISFFLLSLLVSLNASTMYTLSNIKKVYPVIEIITEVIPQSHKEMISEEIKTTLDELNIDYSGHDERAFAILITSMQVNKSLLINLELLIGEQVKRLGTNEKVFAATYISREYFTLDKSDDLEDKLEDSLSNLLSRFSEQYEEENKSLKTILINENNFAKTLKYETSYHEAVEKAKKTKKNIMLVLVSNYCPWCRKFEQRVLSKYDVNKLVHENYIPLILNKEKDDFPAKYNKAFSPIVYFIDYKTLTNYETIVGYNKKDEFLYLLKKGH